MYEKPMLSLEQAQAAITAMIAEYNKDTNRRNVDMAVVDDAGNLLAYARMDRCLRPTFGLRKAYTSAVRGMDTLAFSEQLSSQNRSIESFGDAQLIALPGGVVVMKDGAVVTEGPPAEIVTADLVEAVFGLPCRIIDDPESHTPLVIPKVAAGRRLWTKHCNRTY